MLYVNLRGTDKTTKALRIASAMRVPLLVADNRRAMFVEKMSRELGLPVRVFTADDMCPARHWGRGEYCPIVIDDVDEVLRNLFGVEVLLATSTGENVCFRFFNSFNRYISLLRRSLRRLLRRCRSILVK